MRISLPSLVVVVCEACVVSGQGPLQQPDNVTNEATANRMHRVRMIIEEEKEISLGESTFALVRAVGVQVRRKLVGFLVRAAGVRLR